MSKNNQHPEKEAMLPCAFCGEAEDIELVNGLTTSWGECNVCKMTGPYADSTVEAIMKWNTRVVHNHPVKS